MKQTFVSYSTLKLAKEKGFDHNVLEPGILDNRVVLLLDEVDKEVLFPAPTQSELQKWLREVHNIDIIIAPVGNYAFVTTGYYYEIPLSKEGTNIESDSFKTYEEAVEAGLKQALTLIKT